jgi:hypothetical protein
MVYAIQIFISQSERKMFTIFKLLFDNLKEQCLPFLSPLFKNYVVQIPAFIFYTHLKPHSEVPHYSSGHFRWYCSDFVLDSSFSVRLLFSAYVYRLQPSGASRERSHKRRDRVNVLATDVTS